MSGRQSFAEIVRSGAPSVGAEPQWYACYTRARHEKKVDGLLRQRGVESFLPLVSRQSQWHDRKKTVARPLFPSYVFARSTLDALGLALSTPGVATVVRTAGEPTPIPDQEIENVRRFAAALSSTEAQPELVPLLERGQRVRIISGPFEGVEATVVEQRGRQRVLLGLPALGQGFEIDADAGSLEILTSAE